MTNQKVIDENKQYFQKKNLNLFIRQDIVNKVMESLEDNFSLTLQIVVEPKNDNLTKNEETPLFEKPIRSSAELERLSERMEKKSK